MFTLADMREMLGRRPFVPFRLYTSDGGHVDIVHQEFAMPGRRFLVVGLPEAEAADQSFDRWTVVWYMHVTRAEQLRPGEPPLGPSAGGNGSSQEAPR